MGDRVGAKTHFIRVQEQNHCLNLFQTSFSVQTLFRTLFCPVFNYVKRVAGPGMEDGSLARRDGTQNPFEESVELPSPARGWGGLHSEHLHGAAEVTQSAIALTGIVAARRYRSRAKFCF